MNKAAGMNRQKPNLKLVFCLLGIIVVIAILVAMRPLPGNKNSDVTAAKPAAAKHLGNDDISAVSQASPATQSAAAAGRTAGISIQSNPQITQTSPPDGNSSFSSTASVPPASPSSTPAAEPDVMIYPIDPVPCKKLGGFQPYCRTCRPYPGPDGQIGSCPRCPGGGIEMACVYPL
jgi:hypothetical protein